MLVAIATDAVGAQAVDRDENDVVDPVESLRRALGNECASASTERVPASLEDVFVAATGFSRSQAREPDKAA